MLILGERTLHNKIFEDIEKKGFLKFILPRSYEDCMMEIKTDLDIISSRFCDYVLQFFSLKLHVNAMF